MLRVLWSILVKYCGYLLTSSSETQMLLLEKTIFHKYWKVETIQEKFQVTWKPSLKPTLRTRGFLSFEKGEACQSILIILELTWSNKDRLYEKLHFTWRNENLFVLTYFLAYLGSSVKITIGYSIFSPSS